MDNLRAWFADLAEDFGDEVPKPSQTDSIINKVEQHFGVKLRQLLGSGDNGIVYRATDKDVIKFTIDNREAALWARIKGHSISGITQLEDVVQLGDTIVYVIKATLIPYPLNSEQATAVRQILRTVQADGIERAKRARLTNSPMHTARTLQFVREFQKLAEKDDSFSEIPDMLIDLADKHQAHLFDLQPDNFRVREDGKVSLIDPSTPDLLGSGNTPSKLVYEEALSLSLWCVIV